MSNTERNGNGESILHTNVRPINPAPSEHPSSRGGHIEQAFGSTNFQPPIPDPFAAPDRYTFGHNVAGHSLLWALQRWPQLAWYIHDHTQPTKPGRRSARG